MFTGWLVIELQNEGTEEEEAMMYPYGTQKEAIGRYNKSMKPTLLYELTFGEGIPVIREALKKGDWRK